VRGLDWNFGAMRTDCSRLMPAFMSRVRSPRVTVHAGRNPGRKVVSSPSTAAHTGQDSSQRAIMPAATPQGANISNRPRSRSNPTMRGKNITASSLRNGQ
jgi:hypothetical protein